MFNAQGYPPAFSHSIVAQVGHTTDIALSYKQVRMQKGWIVFLVTSSLIRTNIFPQNAENVTSRSLMSIHRRPVGKSDFWISLLNGATVLHHWFPTLMQYEKNEIVSDLCNFKSPLYKAVTQFDTVSLLESRCGLAIRFICILPIMSKLYSIKSWSANNRVQNTVNCPS